MFPCVLDSFVVDVGVQVTNVSDDSSHSEPGLMTFKCPCYRQTAHISMMMEAGSLLQTLWHGFTAGQGQSFLANWKFNEGLNWRVEPNYEGGHENVLDCIVFSMQGNMFYFPIPSKPVSVALSPYRIPGNH